MHEADELFGATMEWLKLHYSDFTFYLERDVVWTVQSEIVRRIHETKSSWRVFNDHKLLPNKRSDLVILESGRTTKVAIEFKYEPSHARTDISSRKFPVVMWKEVEKDIERVQEFVSSGVVERAFAVLIDEGGHFRRKEPVVGSEWVDWGNGVSVLWTEV